MVTQTDLDCLIRQIRAALMNKPITATMKTDCYELQELQEAIEYMAGCISEANGFLHILCAGQLDADPPGRHNFIAGQLKELHSIIKHLTWQTEQVASGDYSQQVQYLGEFTNSFHCIVERLKEQKESLSQKTNALAQNMYMLKSVLEGQLDWTVVMDGESHTVIYANPSAKQEFYDIETEQPHHAEYAGFFEQLRNEDGGVEAWEYACENKSGHFSVRSFPVDWEERSAVAHCISSPAMK